MRVGDRPDRDRPATALRRVAGNAGYLAVADGANKLMLFAYNVIVARHLGAERLGVLSTSLALVTMFAVLTDLGLGALSAREIARDPRSAPKLVSHILAIKLVASCVVILLIAVLANVIGYPRATIRVVYICSLFVFESAVTSYYCWVFQGFERMELTALSRVLQTAVLVVGAFLLSKHDAHVERYAILYVGAGLVSVLFVVGSAAIRLVKPALSFALSEWRRLLWAAAPIGLAATFTMFYYWNGTTLLARIRGSESVGNFSAAFRLVMGLAFAGMAISGAVYPLLSRLFLNDRARSGRALAMAARFMLMVTAPVAVYLSAFSSAVTQVLYGSGFADAAVVLRVLAFWGVFASFNSLLSNFYLAANRPVIVAGQTGIALAANVAMNAVLIPAFGAVGAATALVLTEGASFGVLYAIQRRSGAPVQGRLLLSATWKVLFALVLSLAVAVVVARWSLAAALCVGMVLYVALLVATGCLGRNDLQTLRIAVRTDEGSA
jgi:O-antigen/teichoic acid export membrane protein